MTREEVIDGLKSVRTIHNGNYAPHIDEAIKLLEQENILNKIRAEIKEVQTYKMFEGEDTVYVKCDDVLAIIDKYRTESEDKK